MIQTDLNIDQLADVRTGDKGDTLILAVLPRSSNAYLHLRQHLTCDLVAQHYQVAENTVTRVDVETLQSMVFKLTGALGGGVTGSPVLDGHGKTLSYHLLTLDVPAVEAWKTLNEG